MLDARKLARIMGNRARMRQGRTRTVTLVYRRPEGTAYVAADVVWRAQPYAEPAAAPIGAAGAASSAGTEPAAVRAEFPPEIDPRLVTFVADTPVATAETAASAPRYVVARYHAAGIVTNRWVVELKRLR
jgi:hypothetical protein